MQNALRHLLKDNKFMAHILQAEHTQNVEDCYYAFLMNILQKIFIRILYTFIDVYWQWYTLLSVRDCFNITDSKLMMLKFKCLRTSFNIVISAAVTVMQCTLSSVALFIDIKVTENSFLTIIINLFKSLSELYMTFLITIKS